MNRIEKDCNYIEGVNFQGVISEQFKIALGQRDLEQRFTPAEKALLTAFLQKTWENREPLTSGVDIGIKSGQRLGLADLERTGNYPDGEPFGLIRQEADYGLMAYFWADMPTSDLLIIARQRADELRNKGVKEMTLVVPYLPFQRAERPARRNNEQRELAIAGRVIRDLKEQFQTIVTLDAYSPGTAFFCLENNICLLDLTAIPLLIAQAKFAGCLQEDDKIAIAVGDDGAYELGKMTQYLIARLFDDKTAPLLTARKQRTNMGTEVIFDQDALLGIEEAIVIIPEDIISTGGTMGKTIRLLKAAGAKKIIILADHAIFAPGAENLLKEEAVEIIVTNSRMDKDSLPEHFNALTEQERKRLRIVDILPTLKRVIDLDRAEKLNHVFRYDWEALLAETGLCLAPWQIAHFRQR